jgi:hypothetical protein
LTAHSKTDFCTPDEWGISVVSGAATSDWRRTKMFLLAAYEEAL